MPVRVNDTTIVQPGPIPNRMYMTSRRSEAENKQMAMEAVQIARMLTPKLSGRAAKGIVPWWTDELFGIRWDQSYLWFQESGIKAFTMSKLAGKTIPMWIDDPSGKERQRNPKARTRRTESGRIQVLIFRYASKPGERKRVARRDGRGQIIGWRDVPRSYPGAPGRISHRHPTGHIASQPPRSTPHVGVRWRYPGLEGRGMLQHALQQVAYAHGSRARLVYAVYGGSR